MSSDVEGLVGRLTKLYSALSCATKNYDAEAVAEAIQALGTQAVSKPVGDVEREHVACTVAGHWSTPDDCLLAYDAAMAALRIAAIANPSPIAGDVERVARAIYGSGLSCTPFDELDPATRAVMLDKAKAAIAALNASNEPALKGSDNV